MKRIFVLLLCITLCLALVPAPVAFAEEPDPGPGREPGDRTLHNVTIIPPQNGTVTEKVYVLDGEDLTFTITPAAGYKVLSVLVTQDDFVEDQSWNLQYVGEGIFEFLLEDVRSDLTLEVVFGKASIEDLLMNSFVVLFSHATKEGIKQELVNQFGNLGYVVAAGDISVSNVLTDEIEYSGYGLFTFTVTLDAVTSDETTGYIVESANHIIFKLNDGKGIEVIKVVHADLDSETHELSVPAMHSGTMEIFGYGNLIAPPLDPQVADSMIDGKIPLPFYRAQFHIFSFSSGINLYGFYVIQEDALCVQVAAKTGSEEQRTMQWDLNRYAELTKGDYISDVFFGNKEFVLSLTSSNIGAAENLIVETGEFDGYTIEGNDNGTYSVNFLSDYYDFITINLTINETIQRKLHIRRVGVNIETYAWKSGPPSFNVFHGTQTGTHIDFSDDNLYRVYGTYYIPDNGEEAPYGLYVTYTWADGSKTTAIITEPCNDPTPNSNFLKDNNGKGVFHYGDSANCCDYLLYSGPDKETAPVEISVTVLKDDPTETDAFGGIFFGSRAGVTWNKN